jgi:hypothetical protein
MNATKGAGTPAKVVKLATACGKANYVHAAGTPFLSGPPTVGKSATATVEKPAKCSRDTGCQTSEMPKMFAKNSSNKQCKINGNRQEQRGIIVLFCPTALSQGTEVWHIVRAALI